MRQDEIRQTLMQMPLAAHWSPSAITKLIAVLKPKDFAAGSLIFSEGEEQPWLYLIVAGEVALEMCVPARGCTRIMTLAACDWLAWSAVLGKGRMTATAVALTAVHTLAASSSELRALCASDHEFGYEFMCELAGALSKRLVATRLQLLDLYDVSAGHQLATAALP